MIKEYKKLSLFPTEILVFKTGIDTDKLAKHVKTLRRDIDPTGIDRSNIGGWHSKTSILEAMKEFTEVFKVQSECLEAAMRNYTPYVCTLENSWANINVGKDFNRYHIHPKCYWSCCLYIKIPGGAIEFEDPRAVCQMEARALMSSDNYAFHKVTPEEGDLVMFPSWLSHRTLPSNSTQNRITIASNYKLRRQDER